MAPARWPGVALLALAFAGVAPAAPPEALDFLTREGLVVVAVPNLADFKARADKLVPEETAFPKPSALLNKAFAGLGWEVDERKPAAFRACLFAGLGGMGLVGELALPYRDRGAVARAWEAAPDKLRDGEARPVPPVSLLGDPGQFPFVLLFRILPPPEPKGRIQEGHAHLGLLDVFVAGLKDRAGLAVPERVAPWRPSPALRESLTPEQRQRLAGADAYAYLAPNYVEYFRGTDRKAVEEALAEQTDWVPARERPTALRIGRALALETRDALAAVRLDAGLHLDATLRFVPKAEEAPALLRSLAAGRTSSLAGLPAAEGLLAAAAIAGPDDADAARALLRLALNPAFGVSPKDPLVEALPPLYGLLRAGRVAVYATGKPGRHAAVAVLEPRDCDAFVAEVARRVKAWSEGTAFPILRWRPGAEERFGATVHHLEVGLHPQSPTELLEGLLGPDWGKIRVAVVGDKLIVLVGSDLALLEAAIANVRAGKPGLEVAEALAEFRKAAPTDRRCELHLAAPALGLPATLGLTSLAVRSDREDLGLVARVPAAVVRTALAATFPKR